jgi:energy-converting hydrogenase Eha subunit G
VVISDAYRVMSEEQIAQSSLVAGQSSVPLLAHGIHTIILRRLLQDLQIATASHEALFASSRKGLAGESVGPRPVAASPRLLDAHSLRSSTKLVVILLLLLLEEGLLGFPGGSQVAFYATFFASTGNLGRQNKTDLVGLAGLLGGFAYGVVAAFLTSHQPHFPLLLALVFLGEFLANLAYQRLRRYGPAGLQAGLAIPFAYLATSGPEWGSFTTVQTRFWGLVVAGFTAVVVHAYLWPVLPMRQLRASIAAALRATAVSLAGLFGPARPAWAGAPPSLGETVTRARDLLDDARYLPGPEHADPAYNGILACLQEIDANLEYVHFLVGLEEEHPLRQRFFQTIGDYAEQARGNLERVARQFQQSPRRAAHVEPIRWEPDTSGRWESAARDVGPAPDRQIDPWRPAIIAQCLDQVARVVAKMSANAWEINQRNRDR